MTITLHLDTEQAALIEAALEFGVAALESRAARVDPDRVLSDSHKLQAIKLQQVQEQMKAPPIVDYQALDKADRDTLDAMANRFVGERDDTARTVILQAMMDHCDVCRLKASKA